MFADLFVRLCQSPLAATPSVEQGSLYDRMHMLRLIYEEVHRTHVALVRWTLSRRAAEPVEDPLFASVRRALLEHPIAAQAAMRALAEEGRRYARTAAGQADWERVRRSPWLPRFRELWSELTLNVVEDHEDTVVPSMILDLLHALTLEPEGVE